MDFEILLTLLDTALHRCSDVVVRDGGLLASLLVMGLVGGVTHCAGMCGPFVLSQVTARLEATPASAMREWRRLTGAALLPYHLGRITTYALLGATGALAAGMLSQIPGLRWLSAALLMAAAVLLVGYAVPSLRLPGLAGGHWGEMVGRLAKPLFAAPTGFRGWLLGVALGFIPCGLVYGAVAAASAGGDPLAGAMGMAAFAVGTVPALVGVGVAGHVAARHWRGAILRYAPLLLLLNAAFLTFLAWHLIA